jgi:predicted oxidoreductase
MGLGGSWDTEPLGSDDISTAFQVVDTALEAGYSLFDHADIYTMGKAEAVFSHILKDRPGLRQEIVIQSKCGIRFANTPVEGTPGRYDFSHDYIIQAVEASLNRLGTDYLDILLLHRPDPLVEPEQVAKAFDTLLSQGKVRHFGVSNHNWAQISLLQQVVPMPLVVNQIEMSLAHYGFVEAGVTFNQETPGYPQGVEGTVEYCRQHNIQLQAWSPLAKGFLSGRPLGPAEQRFAPVVQLVAKYAAELQVFPEAVVLAWLLKHPAGIVPIIGTTNLQRIRACAQTDSLELTREEWYHLYSAARGAAMP